MQDSAPAADDVPALQAEQLSLDDAPTTSELFPAAHSVQRETADDAEYVPAGHAWQTVLCVAAVLGENCPTPQAVHGTLPAAGL